MTTRLKILEIISSTNKSWPGIWWQCVRIRKRTDQRQYGRDIPGWKTGEKSEQNLVRNVRTTINSPVFVREKRRSSKGTDIMRKYQKWKKVQQGIQADFKTRKAGGSIGDILSDLIKAKRWVSTQCYQHSARLIGISEPSDMENTVPDWPHTS